MSSKLRRAAVAVVLAGLAVGAAGQSRLAERAPLSATMRSYYQARLANSDSGRYDLLAGSPIANPARDPLLDAVVTWDRLRRDDGPTNFAEIAGFLRTYRGWPAELTLRKRAEKLLDASVPTAARLTYFGAYPPLSATAKLRLAEAQAASGKAAEATASARDAWSSSGLDAVNEAALQATFGSALTPADHLVRVDRLLWAGQTAAAMRLLPLLPADRQAWAAARIGFRNGVPDAATRYAAVPGLQQREAGLMLDRAQWLRKTGDGNGARALLGSYNEPPGLIADPETWLKVRLEVARAALRDGQFDAAYQIAANHRTFALGRPLTERSLGERQLFVDTEWTAGWLALRKLGRAGNAVRHFQNLRTAALTPVSQSRGDYWTGRAAEAAGQPQDARDAYTAAAAHSDYFYGQLAAEKLGSPLMLPAAQPVTVRSEARGRFDAELLVRVTRALGQLGDRTRQTIFMRTLVDRADSAETQRLLGDLGRELDRPDLGVLTGKAARADGEMSLLDVAYPRLTLPPTLDGSWTMIHAIARQESQFDRAAVSRANARGLMQLLPGTASDTAAKLGLPYSMARLTEDPVYNVTLGASYFGRIRELWDGNHVLAVASYNAGPGNARKFIAMNGDPRDAGVDVVDWIEGIPFAETRDYVQRVLGNAVVYDLLHPETATMPAKNRLSGYLGRAA